MTEYKKIIIDNIDATYKTISIAVDTMINTSNGPIKINRWRCAYAPNQRSKLLKDLEEQCPENNNLEVLQIVNLLWTDEVISNYQKMLENVSE